MKFFKTLLLALILSTGMQAHAAVTGRLLDILFDQTRFEKFLVKVGFGASSQKTSSFVGESLKAFFVSGKGTKEELLTLLKGLGESPDDQIIRRELLSLLDTKADTLTSEQVAKAMDHLFLLSNRYGKSSSTILACGGCAGGDQVLAKDMKYTLESIKSPSVRNAMASVPKTPSARQSFISKEMRSLRMGNFSKVSKDSVDVEDERLFAVFVTLAKEGSAATPNQRGFINSLLDLARQTDGQIDLFADGSASKLWRLIDQEDEALFFWSLLLKETSVLHKGSMSQKDAFFSVLTKRAGDDPQALANVKRLQELNCFFK